ncbi:hypothetical protein [Candidatus Leptofilum sp.]|uniref:hypothetical protein n=1 Tax=Candidatus Leptofilum sp. TaxID=3241576 RepID=UPI003B5B2A2E
MTKFETKSKIPNDLTWLVVLAFTVVWILFIHSRAYSTNEASRMASIESLVHRGTWVIEDSSFAHTLDKIQVDGQFYSTKPPMLSFLGAGVYAVLHHGFGQTLTWRECIPDLLETNCRAILELGEVDWVHFILVLLLVSTPATLILALTYRFARRHGFANWSSLLFTAVLGLGTALFPYSTVFSNHILSSAGIFVAVYILLLNPNPTPFQLGLAGFAATLAGTVDLSAGIYLVGIFGYVVLVYRQTAVYFILGSLIPGLLAIYLNWQIVGTPLPPQLFTQGYDYEGSAFLTNPGGHRTPSNVGEYAFHLLVGDRGLFSFYPIVIWFVYGLVKAVRAVDLRTRHLAWAYAGASLLYLAYFVFRTHSFGGFGFGTRWLINPVPAMALFALEPSLYRSKVVLKTAVLVLVGAISIINTYPGALNPWRSAYPLFRLTYAAPEERQLIPVALSGYGSYEHVSSEIRSSFGANTVHRRWFDARSSLVVPQGEAWWFIHESTPLPPSLAAPFGLDVPQTYALNADLTATARQWIGTFANEVYQSEMLVPVGETAVTPISLPLTFTDDGDSMALRGYQIEQSGANLTLLTAWEIETREYPAGERKIFIHLLAADGTIVAQNDFFAATYETLFPGDLFFQQQTLNLEGVPAGRYWLQMGVYDPLTGTRLTADGLDRLLLQSVDVAQ